MDARTATSAPAAREAPPGPDLRPLIAAAARGDERALETLYRDLAPAVIGYVRGRGAAEPEDLASEVFVAMVRGLRGFRGDERAFRSWVFSIAHRRLLDERRRRARRPLEVVDPIKLYETADARLALDGDEEVLAHLDASGVIAALGSLTSEQRNVVLLRVVADLSVAEVAGILDRSQDAVKQLHRRGLARLAKTFSAAPVT